MVHSFRFTYDKTYYFIWDSESGSLFEIDYPAFLCAKNLFEKDSMLPADLSDFKALDSSVKKETEQELLRLKQEGTLDYQAPRFNATKSGGEIKAMCLHICHDCNLSCKYCFAGGGGYSTPKDYMTLEVGLKAIDFLIEKSGKRKNLEVDFFGGEPLMNMETVKGIVAYARERGQACGKSFSFTMTTNGLLLNDENIEYLNAEMENVVISIDGRAEVHSALRLSRNGKDCFDVILNNAKKFRAVRGDKRYYIRGTFTANNLDFEKDAEFLVKEGFDQISLEPVVLPEESEFAIKEKDIPFILEEYERLANFYLNSRKKKESWFNFFHFMFDLENGPCIKKRLTGCGAGSEYVAVIPTGEMYPCHQFAGKQEYYMGSVLDGSFNEAIQKRFASLTVYSKDGCDECFAKYYCSGGCCANSVNFTGTLTKPYQISCALMKKRLELSLAIAAIERREEA